MMSINSQKLNVLNQPLQLCCSNPITGYYRNGFCQTDESDRGRHVVCAIITQEFLDFTFSKGNDLITPRPEFQFPGLKPGDKWCLCVLRWKEAYLEGCAPQVILESTELKALDYVSLEQLQSRTLN